MTAISPQLTHLNVRDYVVETRGQRLRERYDLRLTEGMKEWLQNVATEQDVDISDVIRAAVAFSQTQSEPVLIDIPTVGAMLTESFVSGELQDALTNGGLLLPVLGEAPCGPLREVLAESDINHFLSPVTAQWLEAKAGDVLINCDGEDMDGVGISDGALLLVRPLPPGGRPQRGEVVLVQFKHKSGQYSSTIKTWVKADPVLLHNGQGEKVELPPDLDEVVPVALARGILSRYTRIPRRTQ